MTIKIFHFCTPGADGICTQCGEMVERPKLIFTLFCVRDPKTGKCIFCEREMPE